MIVYKKQIFQHWLVFSFCFVEPPTIDQVPPFIEAKTTTSSFKVSVFYFGRAPLGSNITLFKDGSLVNQESFSKGLGDGPTTIEVYTKSDTGNYTVMVETVRHDGAEPPYKLTDEISFFIQVLSEFIICCDVIP